jgi:DNA-binding NarL/FixJ family response regulator
MGQEASRRPGEAAMLPTGVDPVSVHVCEGEARTVTRYRRGIVAVVSIRIVLADDNLLVREGLEHVLSAQPDVDVAASCTDLPSLLEAVDRERPNVVLTDIRMPPTRTDEGIRAAIALRVSHPSVGVVVLSQYADPSYALALLESGSDGRGYLLKERIHDGAQLRSAVETVAEGGSVIDPKVVELLVSVRSAARPSPLAQLTPRELEVLAEIAQGKSNTAIGGSLVLTKRSVEKHINSIFLKLNLSNADTVSKRVKAALLFLAEGEAPSGTFVRSRPERGCT